MTANRALSLIDFLSLNCENVRIFGSCYENDGKTHKVLSVEFYDINEINEFGTEIWKELLNYFKKDYLNINFGDGNFFNITLREEWK